MEKSRADPLFDPYYWKKIVKALALNTFTVPIVIAALFFSGLIDDPLSKVMSSFQKSYPAFFLPLDRFFDFFRVNGATPALVEEFFYRGPVRILVGLIVFFRRELNWRFISLVWAVGLFLNYQWAAHHTVHELVWLPVFVAGLAWLWLVIRTNRLWPAVFCHTAANLSIYFLIKIYQFLF